MNFGHLGLAAREGTLLAVLLVGLLLLGGLLLARRARTRVRGRDRDLSARPPVSIVTEPLTDAALGELLHDAIPIDPLSYLSSQLSTIAGPALQMTLAATPAAAQRGRFLVEFSVEGGAALKSASVSLLRRVDGRLQPTLVSTASRLEENATLVGRAGQMTARAAAVAHVVVLLAVQAQLVSMERTLERMEKKLDALRQFLDEQQVSRVRGWLRKLASLRDEMSAGPWTEADKQRWLGVLEAADADLLQVEELAKRQCETASAKIATAKLSVTLFGPSGNSLLTEFLNEVDRYRQYHELRSLTIVGRLVVGHLKMSLGKTSGSYQIACDIDELVVTAARHQEGLAQRAREFRTMFRSKAHEASKQRVLGEEAAEFVRHSNVTIERLRAQLRTLDAEAERTARAIVEVAHDGTLRPIALLPEGPQ